MKKAVAVAMVMLSLTVGTAYAQQGSIMMPTLGVNNDSCGSWIQARRVGGAQTYKTWVAGFLTGASAVTLQWLKVAPLTDIVDRRDDEGLWAWIDNYCQAHPLEGIGSASQALNVELVRKATSTQGK
jgi:hypothetical protein